MENDRMDNLVCMKKELVVQKKIKTIAAVTFNLLF